MESFGMLAVVSGFSGAGKGTAMKKLLETYENYSLSISATTRNPRQGESEGESYFFKSKEEFEDLIKKDCLIEYASYAGHYYGTPKAYVDEQRKRGKDVILEIEVQGALQIKMKYPDTILIFLTPPDALELKRRLNNRGTESQEEIDRRMRRACEEAQVMDQYDYLVINDDLEECIFTLHNIIQCEKKRTFRNENLITMLNHELNIIKKGE